MKTIIPKDSRYIPFTQQKSCCVPTSISMVMYKLGIPLVPQELLGYYLGLIVSKENKKLFWNVRTGKKPKSGYGTRIFESKKYNPNQAFTKLNIPLKMIIHHISKYKTTGDFVSFVEGCVSKNRNILVCFDHGVLDNNKENNGHVCVIDRIYRSKNKIRLIDPSSNQPKWKEVKINKLKKAMELHPSGNGGFWELKKVKNKL